jgi:hypothetical protein
LVGYNYVYHGVSPFGYWTQDPIYATDYTYYGTPSYNGNLTLTGATLTIDYKPGDVAAVPEPGSFVLLALGLAGLYGIGRKREGQREGRCVIG